MQTQIVELRKGERFLFTDPLAATFTGSDVSVLNISLGGVQILHPHIVRLGTHGHLHFRHPDGVVNITGRVAWSQLVRSEAGMVYRSGIAIEIADQQFAAAINAFFRTGAIFRDSGSLERKREQMIAREERRKSQPYLAPIAAASTGDPTTS